MIGSTLAHYRIVEKIGEGGMGEVYRAQDSKLGREVAIKVLPDEFARDPERLARFEREAHLLATLNHPNIAAIYGLEEADGVRCLVLELVPGETLAERLGRGPLGVEEALTLSRQIAEALEAAHEKGIVHRDLKPGNVKVTPEGRVKVLDFGLAKAFAGEISRDDLSKSPTLTSPATQGGALLGTAAYMSPEQARGRAIDRRSDIWAFGCVLFEALTGRPAFGGETISDTLATVLKGEPDWPALPAETPKNIQLLLHRCLQKDAGRRLHDIADVRIEIEEALSELSSPRSAVAVDKVEVPPRDWRRVAPWALSAVLLLATVGLGWQRFMAPRAAPSQPTMRFVLPLPTAESLAIGRLTAVALSADGSRLVYVARHAGTTILYLRALDQLEAEPIAGTEGAEGPFFSPDGQWIGFFAGGKLKKVSVNGGAPFTLCDAPDSRGASWGPDDAILFAPMINTGLWRVSAAGGKAEPVTKLDAAKGERIHRWPQILPGGEEAFFTLGFLDNPDNFEPAHIAVVSLKTGERRTLLEGGYSAQYVASGHLVYSRAGALVAVPFDVKRLQVTGVPVPVVEGVMAIRETGAAHFALSRTGTLIYVPGGISTSDRTLLAVDRRGSARPLAFPLRSYDEPRFSPDGRRLALAIGSPNYDIWISELTRGTLTRLTFGPGSLTSAVWTPDARRMVYSVEGGGQKPTISWKPADGSGAAEVLITSEYPMVSSSVSPDGQVLAFSRENPGTGNDIWILPLVGDRKPQPFLQTPFDEFGAQFSPDGHWMAYVSNESGTAEVYVQPYPGPGGKWQVSTNGGVQPVWGRNGREIFYRSGDRVMVVPVETRPTFTPGTPKVLFEGAYLNFNGPYRSYDVSPDGQSFLMVKPSEQETAATQLHVVVNWFAELRRLVGGDQ